MTIPVFLERLIGILNLLVPFVVGLAVFVIIWGIFLYITKAGEEEKRAEAKKFILFGIIGVFCMLSIWGFVGILYSTFSIDSRILPGQIPKVPVICPPRKAGATPPPGCY